MCSAEAVPVVACRQLVRRFGERRALDGVDLELATGETLVLTGGNGAGKTTLLRVLATVLRPHGGSVSVAGHDLPRQARAARPSIGYVGHEPLVYPSLTALENLQLYGELHGVPAGRCDEALAMVGLERRGHDRPSDLSRGMRQRLALARAWLHRPALLLLDEPTAGLDADGRGLLRAMLDQHAGAAVVATHEPEWFAGGRELRLTLGRVAG
jgi:heme exporter protein A